MEENIVVNEDNSGVYSVSIDLGKMIKMISQMGEGNNSEFNGLDKSDSTIYLKDLVLASDSLTPAEKELYKDGFVQIKSDEANEQLKVTMTCPFKKISQLPEIKENFLKTLDKLKAFEKILDKPSDPEKKEDNGEMASKMLTPGSDNNYKFTAEPGKIANTVINIEEYKKEILSDSAMISMQQLTTLLGEMTFKTSITTPREIKKYSGNNAELSGNKKIIVFKSTFTEMIENPEKLAYQVEY
jgi:hypothetical protein